MTTGEGGLALFGSSQGRLWSRALPKAHERGRPRLHRQPRTSEEARAYIDGRARAGDARVYIDNRARAGTLAPTSTTVRGRGRPRHTRRGPGRGV